MIITSPSYTEQNGLYSNTEGRVQECRKASYPTGSAKEDWKIFNLILKSIKNQSIFNSEKDIRKELFKDIKNFSKIDELPKFSKFENFKNNNKFFEEEIKINKLDYYYTNAISRSSKTMSDCRSIKNKELKKVTNY